MNTTLKTWLTEGPYTLALSSHFFGFYSHAALLEQLQLHKIQFRPQKITGTSAGALVGAALASGLSPSDFKSILFSKTTKDYWDPQLGLGLLAGRKFLDIMRTLFPENFTQTQIPLEVGAVEMPLMRMRFLNSGSLPQAVLASCAVPVLFPPVKISNRWYYDGGVREKSGINILNTHERVLNIYLDSQSGTQKHISKLQKIITSPHQRIIYFPNTPRVNPRNLETGKIAYQKTLLRSHDILDQKFAQNILVVK